MDNILVSVIIPVYNTEQHLPQCLDSILNQTLQNIEIICVDDGSTDGSPDILEEYALKDNRVIVLHQQNQFAGVARNHGMEIARGEYLYFLDSDDFVDQTLLEKTYTQAKKFGNADIVLFDGKKYDETKGIYIEAHYLQHDLLPDQSTFSRVDFSQSLLRLTTPCPWTKLFRREFVEEAGLSFQSSRNSNDVFFVFVAIALAQVITVVESDLVYYRVGQKNNLQNNKDESPTDFIDAFESVYHELKKRDVYSDIEAGFVDQTLSGCVYNLNTVKSNAARMKICERLQAPSFTEMGLLNYPDDYYANLNNVLKVRGTKNAVEWGEKFSSFKDSDFHTLIDNRQTTITPEVSVIIPVYNTSAWLRPCLESILNQTLKDIEVLCVDDGSTDSSQKILLEIAAKDNRVAVFAQGNSGQSSARNHGMEQARGRFIYFMDSDDLLAEEALEKLAQQADRYNLEVLCFNGEIFPDSPDLGIQSRAFNYYREFSYLPNIAVTGKDMLVQLIQHQEFRCSPCLFIIRRDFCLTHDLHFLEGIIHEDELYTYKLLLNADYVGYTTDVFFQRRIRYDSVMTDRVSFYDAYSYFVCYVEMTKFINTLDIDDNIFETVCSRPRIMLQLARKNYDELPIDERESLWGLTINQQGTFKSLIVDYCDQQSKARTQSQNVNKLNSQLTKERAVVKKLRKQLKNIKNSHSYKFSQALLWPLRKLREAFKKVKKGISKP